MPYIQGGTGDLMPTGLFMLRQAVDEMATQEIDFLRKGELWTW
jgi:hypothetical protein